MMNLHARYFPGQECLGRYGPEYTNARWVCMADSPSKQLLCPGYKPGGSGWCVYSDDGMSDSCTQAEAGR